MSECLFKEALRVFSVAYGATTGLGILETVKLVNYVRQQVAMGKARDLDLSSASFLDDQYLKPVLEDDPLLYSLEDVMKFEWVEGRRGVDLQEAKDTALSPEEASAKIADLQQALRETQQTLKATQQRLELALDALRFDETLDEGPNSTSTRPTRSFRKLEQHYKSNYDGYRASPTRSCIPSELTYRQTCTA